MPRTWLAAAGIIVALAGTAKAQQSGREAADFFEKRVRPVLAEACYSCHGPDKQSAGLRVDSLQSLLNGGSGEGASIVPGKPDESPMIRAISHEDEVLKMPPKKKLSQEAIDNLSAWVKMGAPWPASPGDSKAGAASTHWAFQPIHAAPVPSLKQADRVANPIDAFLLAKLEAKGLGFALPADRRTLLRRVSFDLIGLPPTPEEIEAFVNDPDPNAYARRVEALLASPRYGERWGRHWLDVARYADTKGYVFQEERRYPYSYTYRDYVVKAFNDDKPYGEFIVEQIAADLMPGRNDPERLAAMGFLTVGRRFLNNNDDIIDDRIDVVTRGMLGLTVQCARCHDHKYDPIPSEDYYSLYGIFASSAEPGDPPLIGEAPAGAEADDYRSQRAKRERAVEDYTNTRLAEIRTDLDLRLGIYLAAALDCNFGEDRGKVEDAARASGIRPESLRWLVERWKGAFEGLAQRHPAVVGAWKSIAALPAEGFAEKVREACGEVINPAVVEALSASPAESPGEAIRRLGTLIGRSESRWLDDGPPSPAHVAGHEGLLAVLRDPQAPWAFGEDASRRLINRAERDKLQALRKQVAELDVTHPGAPPRAMVLNDKPQPYTPHVFLRGNPGRPGKQVPRRFLKLIEGEDRKAYDQGSGRLELAKAIASPSNPLTARVLVNRVWLEHFGSALLDTPSDFGTRGDPPTHPELLDWLAAAFNESGGSIKALHRLIVLSNAYQQSSEIRPEAAAIDPENRLLARANRRRLDFEALRDGLLAVAGRLDDRMGGRGITLSNAPFSTRRTIYGFIDRQDLDASYRTFDFAIPDASSPKRFSTIVPQQALYLLNSPFIAEQANALAKRAEQAGGEPADRIQAIYRRALGRAATAEEVARARSFLGVDRSGDEKLSPLAALAQVLLWTNEFLFLD
ncbi:MAG: PSD1 and planctomycete cytochrome C domain-containing protein [Isosphaeraceae bacterium]